MLAGHYRLMRRSLTFHRSAILACLFVAIALTPAAPRAAGAEVSDPFPGTTNPSTQTTSTSTQTVASSSSGSSSSDVLIGLGAAGVLLVVIALLITRDARRVAPAGDGLPGGSSGSAQVRMRKRRAKAKAARRQRKRNR
jgi:hypothetical protein